MPGQRQEDHVPPERGQRLHAEADDLPGVAEGLAGLEPAGSPGFIAGLQQGGRIE